MKFVDETTFPGFRVQSMFERDAAAATANGDVHSRYFKQIEDIMVAHYGPRNPLILATCDRPEEIARGMAKQLIESCKTDFWMRELSMVVVDVKTDEVVSLLIVRTFRPHDLNKCKAALITGNSNKNGDGRHLAFVKAILDDKALHSDSFTSSTDADVAQRFRRCVEIDAKNLGKGTPNYVPLVMEGAAQLNVPKKAPKGIAVHLGGLQVRRGAALGVKFTVSYVNDLSNSASSAQNSVVFGPALFKDIPELTAGSEVLSTSRREAIFGQVRIQSSTGGVSETLFPGEILKIYDIDAITQQKVPSVSSKL